jgi:hypothetical protein
MALRSRYRLSGRLKKRIWWSRWSNVSRFVKAMRTQFLHPGHRKKRIGQSCLSVVSSRRKVLRTNNLPSGRLKKRLWWSRWSNILRCGTCDIIFCVLGIQKSTLMRSHVMF